MPKPTRLEICMADHDHALLENAVDFQTGKPQPCVLGAKRLEIELNDAEMAQREADRIAYEAAKAAEEEAKVALATLKASAKAKLVAGQPMTEEEAATIII